MTLAGIPTTAYQTVNLIAASLSARDHATVIPFDPGRHRATVLSWADAEATWADADCVVIPSTIIVTVTIPSELNIDALGFNRDSERSSG
jgi:hypothetical protein